MLSYFTGFRHFLDSADCFSPFLTVLIDVREGVPTTLVFGIEYLLDKHGYVFICYSYNYDEALHISLR